MADAPWLLALSRGCCSRAAAHASGCRLCVPRYDAIDRLAAVVEAAQLFGEHETMVTYEQMRWALAKLDAFGSDGDG